MVACKEVIEVLQGKCKDGGKTVEVEVGVVQTAIEGLQQAIDLEKQLADANELLSLKPTLAKKLNDKIKTLEAEIEVLRDRSKMNELEKKVQRLELELKQSYATKNFTLKNGLLEIEKKYRDYIYASDDVEELWSEVTLLLVEDKESLPPHILQRKARQAEKTPTASTGGAAKPDEKGSRSTELVSVQQQVEKYQEAGVAPGMPLDASAPRPRRHSTAGALLEPDARYSDVLQEASALVDASVEQRRELYKQGLPYSLMPGASPLRPVSLFTPGGRVDASALRQETERISFSIAQLRELFAACTYAPTPLGPTAASPAQEPQEHAAPDASYFDKQVDALSISVEELMKMYASLAVGPWPPAGPASGESGGNGAQPASHTLPDASYFDHQAEAVLSSIRHLQQLYQQHAEQQRQQQQEAGGGATEAQQGAQDKAPDASYFDTRADELSSSIQHLRLMFKGLAAEAAGGQHSHLLDGGLLRGADLDAAAAPVSHAGAYRPPDARAGDADLQVQGLPVDGLIAVFSSFLAHANITGLFAGQGQQQQRTDGEGTEASGQQVGADAAAAAPAGPTVDQLMAMFAEYVRAHGAPLVLAPRHNGVVAAGMQGALVAATAGQADRIPLESSGDSFLGLPAMLSDLSTSSLLTTPPNPRAQAPSNGQEVPMASLSALAGMLAETFSPYDVGSPASHVTHTPTRVTPARTSDAGLLPAPGSVSVGSGTPGADPLMKGLWGAAGPSLAASQQQVEQLRQQLEAKHADVLAFNLDAAMLWNDAVALVRVAHAAGATAAASAVSGEAATGTASDGGISFRITVADAGAGEAPAEPIPLRLFLGSSSPAPRSAGRAGTSGTTTPTSSMARSASAALLLPTSLDMRPGVGAQAATSDMFSQPSLAGGLAPLTSDAAAGEAAGLDPGVSVPAGQAASAPVMLGINLSPSEITPAVDERSGRASPLPVETSAVLSDDHEAVIGELKSLNISYAERLAQQSDAIAALTNSHKAAVERADDLQVRVQQLSQEVGALREDNDVLTRMLVESKMACAEKESENLGLKQRLKRSLVHEMSMRDENEDLKRKLMVVSPDEVVMEDGFGDSIRAATSQLNVKAGATVVEADTSEGQAPKAATTGGGQEPSDAKPAPSQDPAPQEAPGAAEADAEGAGDEVQSTNGVGDGNAGENKA